MRTARMLFAVALVLGLASVAKANSLTDPGVIIKTGGQSPKIGPHFTLLSPTGTQTFPLRNTLPGTVHFSKLELTFNVARALLAGTNLHCAALSFFSSCEWLTPHGPANTDVHLPLTSSGPFSVLFFGGSGINVNDDFDIQISGWASATGITGAANVPEPATITLVMLGAGAALLRRRRITV